VGDIVLAVGDEKELGKLEMIIGERVEKGIGKAAHIIAKDIFVSNKSVIGKRLKELALPAEYGVVVTRIRRNDMDFFPLGERFLEHGDLIRVVGEPENVKRFKQVAGSDESTLDETNILVLSLGLALGILIGLIPFKFGTVSFRLGLAGGPLFVALLFSHFGKIGPFNVRVPNAAKFILRELGLALFLVGIGLTAGSQLVGISGDLLLRAAVGGLCITTVTIVVTFLVAYKVFKFPVDTSLGSVCGGMTSTPAFGILSKNFEGINGSISYASVYPVALISITFFTQLFVLISSL
jgi:putative transport protein